MRSKLKARRDHAFAGRSSLPDSGDDQSVTQGCVTYEIDPGRAAAGAGGGPVCGVDPGGGVAGGEWNMTPVIHLGSLCPVFSFPRDVLVSAQ